MRRGLVVGIASEVSLATREKYRYLEYVTLLLEEVMGVLGVL